MSTARSPICRKGWRIAVRGGSTGGGHGRIVVGDHGDVFGHAYAQAREGQNGIYGHRVRRANQGRRALRRRQAQDLLHAGRDGWLEETAGQDHFGGRQARSGQGVPVAVVAPTDAPDEVLPGQHGDPPVSQRQQVLGGGEGR